MTNSVDPRLQRTAEQSAATNLRRRSSGDSSSTSTSRTPSMNRPATTQYLNIISYEQDEVGDALARSMSKMKQSLSQTATISSELESEIKVDKQAESMAVYSKLAGKIINRDQALQERVAQNLSTSKKLVRSRDAASSLQQAMDKLPPQLKEGSAAGKDLAKFMVENLVNLTDTKNMGAGLERDLAVRQISIPKTQPNLRMQQANQKILAASLAYIQSNQPEVLATLKSDQVEQVQSGSTTAQAMTQYLHQALNEFPDDSTYLDIFKQNRNGQGNNDGYADKMSEEIAKRIHDLISQAATTAKNGNLIKLSPEEAENFARTVRQAQQNLHGGDTPRSLERIFSQINSQNQATTQAQTTGQGQAQAPAPNQAASAQAQTPANLSNTAVNVDPTDEMTEQMLAQVDRNTKNENVRALSLAELSARAAQLQQQFRAERQRLVAEGKLPNPAQMPQSGFERQQQAANVINTTLSSKDSEPQQLSAQQQALAQIKANTQALNAAVQKAQAAIDKSAAQYAQAQAQNQAQAQAQGRPASQTITTQPQAQPQQPQAQVQAQQAQGQQAVTSQPAQSPASATSSATATAPAPETAQAAPKGTIAQQGSQPVQAQPQAQQQAQAQPSQVSQAQGQQAQGQQAVTSQPAQSPAPATSSATATAPAPETAQAAPKGTIIQQGSQPSQAQPQTQASQAQQAQGQQAVTSQPAQSPAPASSSATATAPAPEAIQTAPKGIIAQQSSQLVQPQPQPQAQAQPQVQEPKGQAPAAPQIAIDNDLTTLTFDQNSLRNTSINLSYNAVQSSIYGGLDIMPGMTIPVSHFGDLSNEVIQPNQKAINALKQQAQFLETLAQQQQAPSNKGEPVAQSQVQQPTRPVVADGEEALIAKQPVQQAPQQAQQPQQSVQQQVAAAQGSLPKGPLATEQQAQQPAAQPQVQQPARPVVADGEETLVAKQPVQQAPQQPQQSVQQQVAAAQGSLPKGPIATEQQAQQPAQPQVQQPARPVVADGEETLAQGSLPKGPLASEQQVQQPAQPQVQQPARPVVADGEETLVAKQPVQQAPQQAQQPQQQQPQQSVQQQVPAAQGSLPKGHIATEQQAQQPAAQPQVQQPARPVVADGEEALVAKQPVQQPQQSQQSVQQQVAAAQAQGSLPKGPLASEQQVQQPAQPQVQQPARPVVAGGEETLVAKQPVQQAPQQAQQPQQQQPQQSVQQQVAAAQDALPKGPIAPEQQAQQPAQPQVQQPARPVVADGEETLVAKQPVQQAPQQAQQPQQPLQQQPQQSVQQQVAAAQDALPKGPIAPEQQAQQVQQPAVQPQVQQPQQPQQPATSEPPVTLANFKSNMYARLYGQMQKQDYEAAQIKQPTVAEPALHKQMAQVQADQDVVQDTFNRLESLIAKRQAQSTQGAPSAQGNQGAGAANADANANGLNAIPAKAQVEFNLDLDVAKQLFANSNTIEAEAESVFAAKQAASQAMASAKASGTEALAAEDDQVLASNKQPHRAGERLSVAETVAALKQEKAEAEEQLQREQNLRAKAETIANQERESALMAPSVVLDEQAQIQGLPEAIVGTATGQQAGLAGSSAPQTANTAQDSSALRQAPNPAAAHDADDSRMQRLYEHVQQNLNEARNVRAEAMQTQTTIAQERAQAQILTQQQQQQQAQQQQQVQAAADDKYQNTQQQQAQLTQDQRATGGNTVGDTTIRATGTTLARAHSDAVTSQNQAQVGSRHLHSK